MQPRRARPLILGGGLLGLWILAAPPAAAQEDCVFAEPGNDLLVQRPPFTYVTNPHFRCDSGVEIWGDSAVVNGEQAMFRLIGSARYTDGVRELTSLEARYFSEVGRLQAEGRVRVLNRQDGSTVENGDLVYLRQTEYRDIEEMTFTTGDDGLRPRATVYPQRPPPEEEEPAADSARVDTSPADTTSSSEAEPEEYVVIADRIFFRGSSYFDADGSVEIVRDSLHAFADSAEYTGEVGELVLAGAARVEGSGYDLVGRTITLASTAGARDEIRALEDAVVTGDDLRVTAPQIVLHLADGELERMVAVPLQEGEPQGGVDEETDDADAQELEAAAPAEPVVVRPVAVSGDMELTGDSLDLAAPGGTLERIFAAGSARSVSNTRPDLNVDVLPELARRDWIEGDTIEVLLRPGEEEPSPTDATPPEDSDTYEVDRIIARLAARSLYRLTPSDSTAVPGVDPPALSYIVADQITIFMVDGQADRVESVGEVTGWHLEPLTPGAREDDEEEVQGDADGVPGPTDGDAPADPDDISATQRGDAAAPGA